MGSLQVSVENGMTRCECWSCEGKVVMLPAGYAWGYERFDSVLFRKAGRRRAGYLVLPSEAMAGRGAGALHVWQDKQDAVIVELLSRINGEVAPKMPRWDYRYKNSNYFGQGRFEVDGVVKSSRRKNVSRGELKKVGILKVHA